MPCADAPCSQSSKEVFGDTAVVTRRRVSHTALASKPLYFERREQWSLVHRPHGAGQQCRCALRRTCCCPSTSSSRARVRHLRASCAPAHQLLGEPRHRCQCSHKQSLCQWRTEAQYPRKHRERTMPAVAVPGLDTEHPGSRIKSSEQRQRCAPPIQCGASRLEPAVRAEEAPAAP